LGLPGDGLRFLRRRKSNRKHALNRKTMWPCSNKAFVPASEPRIFIYVSANVSLDLRTGAGEDFISIKFSNPESRSAQMPAAFSMAVALG
jgi:hypothetical protein